MKTKMRKKSTYEIKMQIERLNTLVFHLTHEFCRITPKYKRVLKLIDIVDYKLLKRHGVNHFWELTDEQWQQKFYVNDVIYLG